MSIYSIKSDILTLFELFNILTNDELLNLFSSVWSNVNKFYILNGKFKLFVKPISLYLKRQQRKKYYRANPRKLILTEDIIILIHERVKTSRLWKLKATNYKIVGYLNV